MSATDPVIDWEKDFDHMDRKWTDDAHTVWDALREKCPIAHTDRYGGVYLPTRFKDISDAAYADELFSSRTIIVRSVPLIKPFVAPPMNATGEHHRRSRRRLMAAFSKLKVEQFRSIVEKQARELVLSVGADDRVDVTRAYTQALSARAVMRFVGVPERDAALLNRWTADVLIFGVEDAKKVAQAADQMSAYCRDLALKRFREPINDVASMLMLDWDGKNDDYLDEIAVTLRLLLLAGLDTTASVLTGALWHLAGHSSDRQTLASDHTRMPAAIEEFLRVFAPTTMAREINKDTMFAGTALKAGQLIMLPFPAANRDPTVFPNPNVVDLCRKPNKHLAFGIGIHRCLGDHLAKMIIEIGIRVWLARFPNFELYEDPQIEWSIGTVRGIIKLYLRTDPKHIEGPQDVNAFSKDAKHARGVKFTGAAASQLFARAKAMQAAGRLDEALRCLRIVLQTNPKHIETILSLGAINLSRGKNSVARTYFKQAAALNPSDFRPLHNLAMISFQTSRLDDAENFARKAVELAPYNVSASNLLVSILSNQGKTTEALNVIHNLSNAQLANNELFLETMSLKRQVCDWRDFYEDDRKARHLVAQGHLVPPLAFLATQATNAEHLICAQRWAKTFEKPKIEHLPKRQPGMNRHLRIGYLSGDLHDHATSRLVAELFEKHNRQRFTIYGYSYGPNKPSVMRDRIIKSFDFFRDVKDLSSQTIARRIYDDQIDILIDMKGYTSRSRTDILSWKPAPIQVNYLGFPGTMGTDLIDYIITDRVVSPPEYQVHSKERFAYMPQCFQPNDTLRPQPDALSSRKRFGVADSRFVFCCFNAAYKFTPSMFDCWMRIMKAVPDSLLFLLVRSQEQVANLANEAKTRLVDPERIIFAGHATMEEHLARCSLADLFLDTLPVSAFTTASDALWAGLPVLTCAGATPAGRGSASLLHAMGMSELVVDNMQDYELAAIRLAREPEHLRALRQRIEAGRQGRAPFNTPELVRDLEDCYETMISASVSGIVP